jgi:isopenicillin N synthase-like dioxygenase
VRNRSDRDRLSLPFFFDPNWHATLEPIARARIAHPIPDLADSSTRWDGLDLHALTSSTTYGAFVWRKIQTVFPDLATV